MDQVYGVALLPVIIGLVKVSEMIGCPKKFLPIVSLIYGVILGILYVAPENYLKGVFMGLNLGLGAVGLNSSYKNIKEELTK